MIDRIFAALLIGLSSGSGCLIDGNRFYGRSPDRFQLEALAARAVTFSHSDIRSDPRRSVFELLAEFDTQGLVRFAQLLKGIADTDRVLDRGPEHLNHPILDSLSQTAAYFFNHFGVYPGDVESREILRQVAEAYVSRVQRLLDQAGRTLIFDKALQYLRLQLALTAPKRYAVLTRLIKECDRLFVNCGIPVQPLLLYLEWVEGQPIPTEDELNMRLEGHFLPLIRKLADLELSITMERVRSLQLHWPTDKGVDWLMRGAADRSPDGLDVHIRLADIQQILNYAYAEILIEAHRPWIGTLFDDSGLTFADSGYRDRFVGAHASDWKTHGEFSPNLRQVLRRQLAHDWSESVIEVTQDGHQDVMPPVDLVGLFREFLAVLGESWEWCRVWHSPYLKGELDAIPLNDFDQSPLTAMILKAMILKLSSIHVVANIQPRDTNSAFADRVARLKNKLAQSSVLRKSL